MIEHFYSIKERKISPHLQKVFELAIQKKPTSLEEAYSLSQKYFLRPSNMERWELRDPFKYWIKRKQFAKEFEKMGMTSPLLPLNKKYKSILVLGTALYDYEIRLSYLLSLNVKADKIYLLTGERKLQDQEIKQLSLRGIKLARNHEDLMMQALFPKEIPHTIISCANHEDGTRVNTLDTVKKWLEHYKEPGKHLLISKQPYAYYQYALAKNALDKTDQETSFDIAAPKKTKKRGEVSITLDSIARILYELKKTEGVHRVK